MNEACEIINMSTSEYNRQFSRMSESEVNRRTQASFNKVMSPTYRLQSIDSIYAGRP